MQTLLDQLDKGTLWRSPGGIHPPEVKFLSNTTPISQLPLALEYLVPVPHVGENYTLAVKVGDKVLKGTPLTQAQASKIQVGMSHQQVRFLLGSPTVSDPMNPLRWDYIYNYTPGTYAKKAKIPAAQGQHLKVYFDPNGIVQKIEGLETIPASQPGLPASKEAILNAPPL